MPEGETHRKHMKTTTTTATNGNSAAHTAGEWETQEVKNRYTTHIFSRGSCSVLIGEAGGLNHASNGALMAASPELLAALELVAAKLDEVTGGNFAVGDPSTVQAELSKAAAAIKRAKGGAK